MRWGMGAVIVAVVRIAMCGTVAQQPTRSDHVVGACVDSFKAIVWYA
jgi:hypothetical protein